jgi:hypothetical protein
MNEELAIAPHAPSLSSAPARIKFFVVSRRKLAVLYLATLGLYSIYWFYKQWEAYKEGSDFDTDAGKIWPVMRALFPFFFMFSLLRHIREEGQEHPELAKWNSVPTAGVMTALLVISKILDRAAYRSIGSPVTDILSVLVLLPLLAYFASVQDKINLACNDPEGESNARFTAANYGWIALGVVFWLLMFIGLFLPE